MQINGPARLHGAQQVSAPHNTKISQKAQSPGMSEPIRDQLDISPEAQIAQPSQDGAEIRTDLVNRIRSEIANGTYDSPEKMDAALDRFLDELG